MPIMKRLFFPLTTVLALVAICLVPPTTVQAQETPQLEVAEGIICTDVVDREPVGVNTTFAATVDRLCCFTRITGAEEPTTITHVWYFGDIERARVDLTVRSLSWRTHSSKIIQAHESGPWRVDVLDAAGSVLRTIRFEITSAPAPPPPARPQVPTQLEVAEGIICTDVVDREPVGVNTTFAASVDRLCCFTRITGAEEPTSITHVWYFGDIERARVDLVVRSLSWRTHSSKVIQAHEIGPWRVDVLDAAGAIITSIRFTITG